MEQGRYHTWRTKIPLRESTRCWPRDRQKSLEDCFVCRKSLRNSRRLGSEVVAGTQERARFAVGRRSTRPAPFLPSTCATIRKQSLAAGDRSMVDLVPAGAWEVASCQRGAVLIACCLLLRTERRVQTLQMLILRAGLRTHCTEASIADYIVERATDIVEHGKSLRLLSAQCPRPLCFPFAPQALLPSASPFRPPLALCMPTLRSVGWRE